jgi:hypothetical protein
MQHHLALRRVDTCGDQMAAHEEAVGRPNSSAPDHHVPASRGASIAHCEIQRDAPARLY